FASGPEEALTAVQKQRKLNTWQADLALLANSCQLPVQPPKARFIDFPVTIVNLGVVKSEPAKVVLLGDKKTLAEADVPPLRPGEQRVVTMRLDGRLPKVRFEIRQQEPDFDPANDALDLWLWERAGQGAAAKASAKVLLPPADAAPFWVADDVPASAKRVGDWNWHEAPALLSPRSHPASLVKGPSLHYFLRAAQPLVLGPKDNLVQYVYLDPKNPPRQIVLQLYAGGTQQGKRVYWGDNLMSLGEDAGTRAGPLPETGKWIRLRISAASFGIDGGPITGMLF